MIITSRTLGQLLEVPEEPSSLDDGGGVMMTRQHPLSQRFHELVNEIGVLHDKKQVDYGRDTDPFSNVRASEEWGIEGWVGAMIRLNDKVRRLQVFATKGTLANEGAYDSLMDIAVYAIIAYVLLEDRKATRDTHVPTR